MSRTTDPPSRESILQFLATQDAPVTPEELVIALKVEESAVIPLRRRLSAMQRDGQILPNRTGALMPVSRLDLVPGRVSGHRDGFGFMLPDGEGPDVFLPPREMQKVMHGDRVLVRRGTMDGRGRYEGSIVEVTERSERLIVGRLVSERGVCIVVPEDQRIKHDILIPEGDQGAATPGQIVSVRVVRPPGYNAPPIGQVVEVLGTMGDPGMEIEIAVRKFDVPHQFPQAALDEAAGLPDAVRAPDLRRRVDLRDVPLVTIDGEDSRDFDDAVYCEPLDPAKPAAGWRLIVAIADVSHYVQPGSSLDDEAQNRTTSVYFPRRVIPMLPEKISNGLCSLNPEVDRLVLVADMVVDGQGRTTAYQFYPAVMHSAARLTYTAVWGVLSGGDPVARKKHAAVTPQLEHLYALYRVLAKAREVRGAIEFETVETKIVCDAAGRIEAIVPYARNDAHRLIEECMLCANTCTADFLLRAEHRGLFRVHEGPTPDRLARLREGLTGVGLAIGQPGQDPTPADYRVLSALIAGRPDASMLQTMMLRSMQQAVYTPENQGHFGLAYAAYAHFTSPIRRYPDLLNHRSIKSILDRKVYVPVLAGRPGQLPLAPEQAQPLTRRGLPVAPKDQETALGVGPTETAASPTPVARASLRGRTRAALLHAGPSTARATAPDSTSAEVSKAAVPTPHAAPGGETAALQPRGSAAAEPDGALSVWRQLGSICSTQERRADEASRDVEAWLKCQYMRDRVGDEFVGKITGVAPFGVFVTLDALYVEGMVHVSELGREYFQFNEPAQELRGERTGVRFRMADPISVQVSRVDMEGRRIEFRLIPAVGAGPRPERSAVRTPEPGSAGVRHAVSDKLGVMTEDVVAATASPSRSKSRPAASGKRRGKDAGKTASRTTGAASPISTGRGTPSRSAGKSSGTSSRDDRPAQRAPRRTRNR